ncbi:hypothetical protein SPBRAN_188 [uncultured Candidatus Thioglobus sp.]|nr:hypothetical protein SPBRAN_188 [uncultured Candidatus Thioglobus sp.]
MSGVSGMEGAFEEWGSLLLGEGQLFFPILFQKILQLTPEFTLSF